MSSLSDKEPSAKKYISSMQEGDSVTVQNAISENLVNVDFKDKDQRTALHWFSSKGITGTVEFLINHGATIDIEDKLKWTPLHCAASAGKLDANVNALNDRKSSPLDYACSKGHKEIVELLLENHAVYSKRDSNGSTPLHRAVASNVSAVVVLMLKQKNINVNSKTSFNETPLLIATTEKNVEIVKLLLAAGADPQASNDDSETPYEVALKKKDKELIECFDQYVK